MTGQGLQARLQRLCPPCQAPKGCVHCSSKADGWRQRLCPTAAIPPSRPLLHKGRDGTWTEPARHVSVRPAQQRIWWCTRRPKLPSLPQRGEAQTWSLAKPVQTPMAGFKPLSQESNRASSCQRLLSSSPRPHSNSFPTFKSASDLGKQETEHTAVIDMPEQQSETTIRTAQILARQAEREISKKVLLDMSEGPF